MTYVTFSDINNDTDSLLLALHWSRNHFYIILCLHSYNHSYARRTIWDAGIKSSLAACKALKKSFLSVVIQNHTFCYTRPNGFFRMHYISNILLTQCKIHSERHIKKKLTQDFFFIKVCFIIRKFEILPTILKIM